MTSYLPSYFLTISGFTDNKEFCSTFQYNRVKKNLPLGSSQNLLWLRFKSLNALEKKEIIRPTKLVKLGRACQWDPNVLFLSEQMAQNKGGGGESAEGRSTLCIRAEGQQKCFVYSAFIIFTNDRWRGTGHSQHFICKFHLFMSV